MDGYTGWLVAEVGSIEISGKVLGGNSQLEAEAPQSKWLGQAHHHWEWSINRMQVFSPCSSHDNGFLLRAPGLHLAWMTWTFCFALRDPSRPSHGHECTLPILVAKYQLVTKSPKGVIIRTWIPVSFLNSEVTPRFAQIFHSPLRSMSFAWRRSTRMQTGISKFSWA